MASSDETDIQAVARPVSPATAPTEEHRANATRDDALDISSDGSNSKEGTNMEGRNESVKDEGKGASEREPDNEPKYPGPIQLVVTMVCILLAVFIMSLDRTIIATAIPRITDDFNSLGDIGWYGSAFTLTTCSFQLVWGRVYNFYPPKHVFLALIILFEIGSVICGAAPNSVTFIVGRAIAGIGSAGILTGAIVLMALTVPLPKRPFYNSFFSVVLGASSVLGPLLGGAFTSKVSWRWCFYINLPIGGFAILVIFFLLETTPPEDPGLTLRQQLAKLDLLGELFLLPGLTSLLIALQWGGSTYTWSSWRMILLLVSFSVCFIAFIVVETCTQKTAIIQANVVKNRSMMSAMLFMFCLAAFMQMLIYYLPLWLQAIKNRTAVQSGIDTLPLVMALTIGSIFSGQTTGRIGYYTPLAIACSVFMPIGAGLIYTFQVDTSAGKWIGYQILAGFGIGLGLQHGPMVAYTVLDRKDVPIGVSLVFFCQQLAASIFISVAENVFRTKLVANLTGIIPGVDPNQVVHAGATQLRSLVPNADFYRVLIAYNGALQRIWMTTIIMGCLSAIGSMTLEWRSVKEEQGPPEKSEPEADKESSAHRMEPSDHTK